MKTKLVFGSLFLSCFLFRTVIALPPRNVVKMNAFALSLKNYSFQYERVLGKRFSLAVGFSGLPETSLPDALSHNAAGLSNLNLSGVTFTPELRFYLGIFKKAPKGLYIAPYTRFTIYDINTWIDFKNEFNVNRKEKLQGTFAGTGIGLMAGYQWLILNFISIDWWIAGGHIGALNSSLSSYADFSKFEQASIKKELENIELPIGSVKSDVNDNSIIVKIKSPFVGLRTGLAIGIAF